MKNQVKVALLAGGVLVSLASFIPLTTYAVDNPADVTITAVVNPAITLDAAEGFSVKGDSGEILTGKVKATVRSNTKYTVSFKTATSETSMIAEDSPEVIPASADVRKNNDAWAIRSKLADGTDSDYVAIDSVGKTLFTSNGTNDGTAPLQFEVGISTHQSITAGSYSVDLTVTAAAAAP